MSPTLLDANALIALVVEEHEFHERMTRWAAEAGPIAVCPIVEGALVRFLVRLGESADTCVAVLAALHRHPRVEFWEDSVSYLDADLAGVIGHRQVTDAYLASLAAARGAALATFDRALVASRPSCAVLIP
ncbi:PIN domain-containing protein [Agromyces sp. CFH 90414]|uniref:Ribonuclease VapC n=1 Tax=Agromyces agglutinans TaxID=2662258 RepID=A0A6I2F6A2_9MICO|nr:TA system VapC family ribonuclease toxin [Agromyces agglutinans]MRG59831.1 PIN domain-containing protein [Agromyces agglutinans]